ncbi:hypothetical protein PC41400_15030 [Paenibacillus chitinolyticus]|uniref:Uncharacterized protein n=1 Tax=Paenibacillus chitinolyticus TaxID=79263 RepID=A0A410WWU2_9BACL|nr:hypothetical protein PC41400_15030 [Paenibacillus chitinolyticus]
MDFENNRIFKDIAKTISVVQNVSLDEAECMIDAFINSIVNNQKKNKLSLLNVINNGIVRNERNSKKLNH